MLPFGVLGVNRFLAGSSILNSMATRPRTPPLRSLPNIALAARKRKPVPHAFVLEAMAECRHETRSMFGSLAVYVGDKIVFLLRDKLDGSPDNGVWLATHAEHHESLRREFPHMRSIQVFGTPATHWQVLPSDAPDFEAAALRACELVRAKDPRIGKVPASRRAGKSKPLDPNRS
jgi:hypothetical protein